MSAFGTRLNIVKEILADEEYRKKFEDAKTTEGKAKIIQEFCQKRGYKVRKVFLRE